ncbi:DinB family protein [Kribbella sp. CWNU-51]
MTTELEQLQAVLDGLRAGVLKKLAGLSEADARRSTVDSGTNVAGLVQHLTFVESLWFEEIVAGGRATRGKRSMEVDPEITLKTLRSDYRDAWAASDAIIAGIGDPDAPVTRNGKTHDLRWAILAVIGETSRHAGHADIIREQLDGTTGR